MVSPDDFLLAGPWKVRGMIFRPTATGGAGVEPGQLAGPLAGSLIRAARSSWTSRGIVAGIDCHVKVYDYPTVVDRRRGWLRTTWFARSRAWREYTALDWMNLHGFPTAEPLGLAEIRTWTRQLRRSVLVTRTWPGESVENLLGSLTAVEEADLLTATRAFVDALHRAGFRDGNLDLRNLLARRSLEGDWQIAKVDSPKRVLRRCGTHVDRLVLADRRRLERDLARLGRSSLW